MGGSWQILRRAILLTALSVVAAACSQSSTVVADTTTPVDSSALEASEPLPTPADAPTAEIPAAEIPASVEVPAEAIEGPDLDPRGIDVVESLDVLPMAFSTVVGDESGGYFYSAVDGQMALVAFDAQSLEPRYQILASPLGRIRGVGQQVLIDRDLGMVFVTGYDGAIGGEEGGYLAGHDAATGAELWRTTVDFWASQPFECGDKICLRSFSEQRSIDKATGALMQFVRSTDRRILYTSENLTVAAIASLRTDEFSGLVGSSNFGFDIDWEVSSQQLASAVGFGLDPNFGWAAEHHRSDDVIVVHLGRRDGEGWGSVAIDSRTGDVLWGRSDLSPCLLSPLDDVPPVLCRTGDEPFVAIAIDRVDLFTGQAVWSEAVPEASLEVVYDGTKLVMWTYGEGEGLDGAKVERSAETGEELPAARAALCLFLSPWHDFEYPDGDVLGFASGDLYSMCSSDAYLLYPDEVITMSPTLNLATVDPTWLVDFDGVPLLPIGAAS